MIISLKKTLLLSLAVLSISGFAQTETPQAISLPQAQQYARDFAYSIQYADKDIQVARKKVLETIAIGLPQINATADYNYNLKLATMLMPGEIIGKPGTMLPVQMGSKQSLSATATLSQLIFDGSYIVGLRSAKTYKMIAELSKVKTDLSVKQAVTNAYWTVLLAQESVDLAQENLDNNTKNLAEIEESYKVGLVAEEDAEQLRLLVSNLKTELSRSKRMLSISLDMLKYTIGMPLEKQVALSDDIDKLINENIDIALSTKEFNISNNVDFQIAQNTTEGNRLLMSLEKSKALPSLSAFANYGGSTYLQGQTFGSSVAGVSLKIPIFSSLSRSARTAQARIEYEKSKIQEIEVSESLKLNISNAKNNYQYAIDQYSSQSQNVLLARRILDKEQIKYREGVSTSYRITELTNQLISNQQMYLSSILELTKAKAELETIFTQNEIK